MNPISNTAFYCCGVRMDDAKRGRSVCNDIYAERFMDKRGLSIYEPFRSEKMPNISNVTRCRIIDDHISSELKSSGNVNVVTIGAGFDTRPYRLAGGNWIELDEPQIITYKNKKLPVSECSTSLQRIRINFNSEKLSDKLENVDKAVRTIFVIEGVFMYLEREAIERTVDIIQEMFPEHELYCDLMSRRFFEKFGHGFHSKVISTGTRFSELFDRPEEIFISRKVSTGRTSDDIHAFKRTGGSLGPGQDPEVCCLAYSQPVQEGVERLFRASLSLQALKCCERSCGPYYHCVVQPGRLGKRWNSRTL